MCIGKHIDLSWNAEGSSQALQIGGLGDPLTIKSSRIHERSSDTPVLSATHVESARATDDEFLHEEPLADAFVGSNHAIMIEKSCVLSAGRERDGGSSLLRSGPSKNGRQDSSRGGGSMNLLKVLQEIDQRPVDLCCGTLILAASLECGAFIAATRMLFGEELGLRAGDLWAEALEAEPHFRCQNSSMRLVTILAAIKLADLMGAPRLALHSELEQPALLPFFRKPPARSLTPQRPSCAVAKL